MKVKCQGTIHSTQRVADEIRITLHIKYDSLQVNIASLLTSVGSDFTAINDVLSRLIAAQDVVITMEPVEEGKHDI